MKGWDYTVAYSGTDWEPRPSAWFCKNIKNLVGLARGVIQPQEEGGSYLLLTVDLTKQNISQITQQTCSSWKCRGENYSSLYLSLTAYVKGYPSVELMIEQTWPDASTPSNTTSFSPFIEPVPQGSGVLAFVTDDLTYDNVLGSETGYHMSNTWLLLAQEAARSSPFSDCVVCSGPRPVLHMVPTPFEYTSISTTEHVSEGTPDIHCLLNIMGKHVPSPRCKQYEDWYPMTPQNATPPFFSNRLDKGVNFTCITRSKESHPARLMGHLNPTHCHTMLNLTSNTTALSLTVARADVWWYCGGKKVFGWLPPNWFGTCALVSFVSPISVIQASNEVQAALSQAADLHPRARRSVDAFSSSPVYMDAIGIPRGVPDEYKLADNIAAGFESMPIISAMFPVTPIKNVDRINYLHYNIQRLSNFTRDAVSAVHEQLSATSLMSFQNRVAVDFLLAERGGVCAMIGAQCCTFIPNNTAPDGTLSKALHGLRSLSVEMKEHSGVKPWDDFMSNFFGKWSKLVSAFILSVAVFIALFAICGCCCVPCIRALCIRVIDSAIQKNDTERALQLPLLAHSEETRDMRDCVSYDFCSDDANLPDIDHAFALALQTVPSVALTPNFGLPQYVDTQL